MPVAALVPVCPGAATFAGVSSRSAQSVRQSDAVCLVRRKRPVSALPGVGVAGRALATLRTSATCRKGREVGWQPHSEINFSPGPYTPRELPAGSRK